MVFAQPSQVQINFSIYFKYKEVHDFAAKRLEIIKENLDNREPLSNSWKFTTKQNEASGLKIETPKQK